MTWPRNPDIPDIIWKQQENPAVDYNIWHFQSLQNPFQKTAWKGLHVTGITDNTKSLLNGDSQGGWELALGVYTSQATADKQRCLAGPDIQIFPWVTKVQLWVKRYDIIIEAGGSLIGFEEADIQKNMGGHDDATASTARRGELSLVQYPDEPIPESAEFTQWPVVGYERLYGSHGEVIVICRTVDGTATSGEDYVYTRKELKWMDGVCYLYQSTVL